MRLKISFGKAVKVARGLMDNVQEDISLDEVMAAWNESMARIYFTETGDNVLKTRVSTIAALAAHSMKGSVGDTYSILGCTCTACQRACASSI